MDRIQLGNAPCSWGTLEFGGDQGQRTGWRQMLDELVQSGYVGTELGDWGFMPTDPDTLAAELAKRSLTLTGAFVGVSLKDQSAHAGGIATATRVAGLLAAVSDRLSAEVRPFLVLSDENTADPVRTAHAGRVTADMRLSDAQWETFAQGADRIAHAVRETTGLRTVFHHHCAGFVETSDEISRLLDMTDPGALGLVFDTGHYAFGAHGCQDILGALARFAHRLWYVHFKDYNPVIGQQTADQGWDYHEALRHGIFCELGQGCVDFQAVLDWLQNHQYDGFITVEQDVLPGMGEPKASAQRNRAYLRTIGL